MLTWHNKARTDPKSLVPELKKMLTYFGTGDKAKHYSVPGKTTILTNEGAPAVQEAIDWLEKATAVGAMKWDQLLAYAAEDLAVKQGLTTETGHTGPDGSTMKSRIELFGTWKSTIGENIAYGTTGGMDIVLQLIIDDGVPNRGHRTNIFKPEFLVLGSWTSGHKTYSTETVIDYAGGMTTNNKRALEKNFDCTTGQGVVSSSSSSSSSDSSSSSSSSSSDSSSSGSSSSGSSSSGSSSSDSSSDSTCKVEAPAPTTPDVVAPLPPVKCSADNTKDAVKTITGKALDA
jgi:uncharacterized protein YkwD